MTLLQISSDATGTWQCDPAALPRHRPVVIMLHGFTYAPGAEDALGHDMPLLLFGKYAKTTPATGATLPISCVPVPQAPEVGLRRRRSPFQKGTSSAAQMNRATTFFTPALSKAISSLSPSIPVIAP